MKDKMKSIYLFILLEIMFLLLPVFPVNAALPGESCTPYTSSESIARFPTIGWEYKILTALHTAAFTTTAPTLPLPTGR